MHSERTKLPQWKGAVHNVSAFRNSASPMTTVFSTGIEDLAFAKRLSVRLCWEASLSKTNYWEYHQLTGNFNGILSGMDQCAHDHAIIGGQELVQTCLPEWMVYDIIPCKSVCKGNMKVVSSIISITAKRNERPSNDIGISICWNRPVCMIVVSILNSTSYLRLGSCIKWFYWNFMAELFINPVKVKWKYKNIILH